MFSNFSKRFLLFFVSSSLVLSSYCYAADSIDTTAIVESINGTKTPIISIISAMLGILAIVVAYRMIRKIVG